MEDQVRLAVLDQKLEDLKPVVLRIDAAIEKLSEVNTTVSRMLDSILPVSTGVVKSLENNPELLTIRVETVKAPTVIYTLFSN